MITDLYEWVDGCGESGTESKVAGKGNEYFVLFYREGACLGRYGAGGPTAATGWG